VTMTETITTQVYRVYINAPIDKVWAAIVDPEWNDRYGYGAKSEYDLRPGGQYRGYTSDAMKEAGKQYGFPVPDIGVDGEVLEVEAPTRLVQTWRMCMDDALKAEGFTKLTYELAEVGGLVRLTVVHELEGAPKLALTVAGANEEEGAGGGWAWILSGLKTLLETGSPLPHG
jgi:uncharacterized protein YndB with AHSA1/START domain